MNKRVGLCISGTDRGSGRSITPVPIVTTAESLTEREMQKATPFGGSVAIPTRTRYTYTRTRLVKGDRSTAESGTFEYALEYYQIIF
jgi:hypothetical protein